MTSRLHELLRSVDGCRLPLEETILAVATPPALSRRLPRVEHFLAPFSGRVCRVISQSLDLPEPFVQNLIRFGAVYSCPVIPDTSPSLSLTEAEGKLLHDIRNEAINAFGRHPSLRHPRRVQSGDVLNVHAYCRVHVHPKRFPAFYSVDWSNRIILETPHCVVVDKPYGCQVPPRVDNIVECLTNWIGNMIKAQSELKPLHRLDTGTEGLVVLAKTVEFARYFQKLLRRGDPSIEKVYRALTVDRPPLGMLRHDIKCDQGSKGEPRRSVIYDAPGEGTARAELIVKDVNHVRLSEKAVQLWGYRQAYETVIELRTGRTHQIRAQLSHVGCPLLGDGLYGCEASPDSNDDCIGLQAAELILRDAQLSDYFANTEDGCLRLKAGIPWWS